MTTDTSICGCSPPTLAPCTLFFVTAFLRPQDLFFQLAILKAACMMTALTSNREFYCPLLPTHLPAGQTRRCTTGDGCSKSSACGSASLPPSAIPSRQVSSALQEMSPGG